MAAGKSKFLSTSLGASEPSSGMTLTSRVGIKLKPLINLSAVRVGKLADEENDKGPFVTGLEFEGGK